ncbi:MAG: hypothetical protein ABIM30_00225 [candidate division WOR-3 bacterium]
MRGEKISQSAMKQLKSFCGDMVSYVKKKYNVKAKDYPDDIVGILASALYRIIVMIVSSAQRCYIKAVITAAVMTSEKGIEIIASQILDSESGNNVDKRLLKVLDGVIKDTVIIKNKNIIKSMAVSVLEDISSYKDRIDKAYENLGDTIFKDIWPFILFKSPFDEKMFFLCDDTIDDQKMPIIMDIEHKNYKN